MSRWHKLGEIGKFLAPLVLSAIDPKLAPLGSTISHGIEVAESLPGATNQQKLASVQLLAHDTALAINQAHGTEVVTINGLDEAVAHGVSTTISVLNLLHSAAK